MTPFNLPIAGMSPPSGLPPPGAPGGGDLRRPDATVYADGFGAARFQQFLDTALAMDKPKPPGPEVKDSAKPDRDEGSAERSERSADSEDKASADAQSLDQAALALTEGAMTDPSLLEEAVDPFAGLFMQQGLLNDQTVAVDPTGFSGALGQDLEGEGGMRLPMEALAAQMNAGKAATGGAKAEAGTAQVEVEMEGSARVMMEAGSGRQGGVDPALLELIRGHGAVQANIPGAKPGTGPAVAANGGGETSPAQAFLGSIESLMQVQPSAGSGATGQESNPNAWLSQGAPQTGQVEGKSAAAGRPAGTLNTQSPRFATELADQVGRMRVISRPGLSDQVRITLQPRELGELSLRLQVDKESRVNILITADSDAAREVLSKQMTQLKEALARQNLEFGEVVVQVGDEQQQRQPGFGPHGEGGQGEPTWFTQARGANTPEEHAPPPPPPPRTSLSGDGSGLSVLA